jgi:hypothetical protein
LTNFGAVARVVAVELRPDAQQGRRREEQQRQKFGVHVHEGRPEVLGERAQRQPPEVVAGLIDSPG